MSSVAIFDFVSEGFIDLCKIEQLTANGRHLDLPIISIDVHNSSGSGIWSTSTIVFENIGAINLAYNTKFFDYPDGSLWYKIDKDRLLLEDVLKFMVTGCALWIGEDVNQVAEDIIRYKNYEQYNALVKMYMTRRYLFTFDMKKPKETMAAFEYDLDWIQAICRVVEMEQNKFPPAPQ